MPIVDNTGAGDAFSSGFTYGVIMKKDIPTCINWGLKEAYAILGHIGAKNNLLKKLK
jgi:sugar/nucleoside kinase (ribokinase family)